MMQLDFPFSTRQLQAMRSGTAATLVTAPATILGIEGPGALDCLQGLLTSDLVAPGEGSLVYGALLTPKGMIVVDPWVLREAARFTLLLPAHAREAALQLLRRSLPPRLARVSDRSAEWSAVWLLGAAGLDRFARAGRVQSPPGGRVTAALRGGTSLLAAGGPAAPFSGVAVGPAAELEPLCARFEEAGGLRGGAETQAAAWVLAGWPSLGREIDERTLPQEVRYDELGAVSYAKGCYTGQETVARVHFRGHVNRTLQGIELAGAEPLAERGLVLEGKPAGEVRTALLLEDRALGLALVRREVPAGASLLAGTRTGQLRELPFTLASVG